MSYTPTYTARNVCAVGSVVLAIASVIGGIAIALPNGNWPDGWILAGILLLPLYLVGFGMMVVAVTKGASRRLLFLSPVFLVPPAFLAFAWLLLWLACLQGSCI